MHAANMAGVQAVHHICEEILSCGGELSDNNTWISETKVKYQESMHLRQQLLMEEKKAACYAVHLQQMDHSW
jgi:hypothetical protein